jgi:hypothetical protein
MAEYAGTDAFSTGRFLFKARNSWAKFGRFAQSTQLASEEKTKWRWVQSGANHSPAQISLLTGKNTGISSNFGLDERTENSSITVDARHFPHPAGIRRAQNRDFFSCIRELHFPAPECGQAIT